MNCRLDNEESVRALLYIPIVHTHADLVSLGETAQQVKAQRMGRQMWQHGLHFVDRWWIRIEKAIEMLPLPAGVMRLYQEGLPVCGHEAELVADLASAGSRNYRILARLQERGAILMGTESPELLAEEYQLTRESTDPQRTPGSAAGHQELLRSLLKRRDQFIAARINDTLQPGETGLLLLGLPHSITEWLAPEILISYPIHQPMTRR
jgi:hypothetical protein